jgi:hypothetical protein
MAPAAAAEFAPPAESGGTYKLRRRVNGRRLDTATGGFNVPFSPPGRIGRRGASSCPRPERKVRVKAPIAAGGTVVTGKQEYG